jgi:hypothetical protein
VALGRILRRASAREDCFAPRQAQARGPPDEFRAANAKSGGRHGDTMKRPRGDDHPNQLMQDALVREFHREAEKADGQITNRLRRMARKLVDRAMTGDVLAIEEIHDRVDEPNLQDEVQTEDEPVSWTFEWKSAES